MASGAADSGGDASGSSNSGVEDGCVEFVIRCQGGEKLRVQTKLEYTVEEMKSRLAQKLDLTANQIRLISRGRILKDDQTLQSYGLRQGESIYMICYNVIDTETESTTAENSDPNQDQLLLPVMIQWPIFAGYLGVGDDIQEPGGKGARLYEFEQFQRLWAKDPDTITEIVQIDFVRHVMTTNPHLRQIADRNPQLAQLFSDVISNIQKTFDNATNPELMKDRKRKADRAISNLESSPGGFNILKRAYEKDRGELLNAKTMAGETGNGMASNPFAGAGVGGQVGDQVQPTNTASGSETTTTSMAPNTNPLPNPWSRPGGNFGVQGNSNPAGAADKMQSWEAMPNTEFFPHLFIFPPVFASEVLSPLADEEQLDEEMDETAETAETIVSEEEM